VNEGVRRPLEPGRSPHLPLLVNRAGPGLDDSSIYRVAKAAIVHYTRCLATQLRPYGVTANCIAPGGTRTGRFLADRPHLTPDKLQPKGPLQRVGEVEDVAKAMEFFVTDLGDVVSGECIRVDGGASLRG
jgi:3-oxoacyl-[acyl-carrier protein] reductase